MHEDFDLDQLNIDISEPNAQHRGISGEICIMFLSSSPVIGPVTEPDWARFKETIRTLYLVENKRLEIWVAYNM